MAVCPAYSSRAPVRSETETSNLKYRNTALHAGHRATKATGKPSTEASKAEME